MARLGRRALCRWRRGAHPLARLRRPRLVAAPELAFRPAPLPPQLSLRVLPRPGVLPLVRSFCSPTLQGLRPALRAGSAEYLRPLPVLSYSFSAAEAPPQPAQCELGMSLSCPWDPTFPPCVQAEQEVAALARVGALDPVLS